MRLLLVEDDAMIGEAARQGLRHEGHTVDWVRDGVEGEASVASADYDLVLLDLGLPRRDGLSLLKAGARAARTCRCSSSPRATRWPTASRGSTPAPTTIS